MFVFGVSQAKGRSVRAHHLTALRGEYPGKMLYIEPGNPLSSLPLKQQQPTKLLPDLNVETRQGRRG